MRFNYSVSFSKLKQFFKFYQFARLAIEHKKFEG
jgi:hypothetical protein